VKLRGIAADDLWFFDPLPSCSRPFANFLISLFFWSSTFTLVTMIDSNHRIAELAEILATGLQRVLARQSSQNLPVTGESSLHISPNQSGGVPPYSPEAPHD
jgi:hypothetical protein